MSKIEEKYELALKKATETIIKLDGEIKSLKKQDPIALIGMACRLPGGANSPDEFWSLLSNGREAVTQIPKDRFDIDLYYDPDKDANDKIYTRYGNFLNCPIDEFDPLFFEISPIEAGSLDPQQRLLLEVSWEAFENAGINPLKLRGSKTGVFIGYMGNEFQNLLLETSSELTAYSATGVSPFAACGRISYFYDFHGPSMAIDTACSSSLVALHNACGSLQNKSCDLALVGGVNLILIPQYFMALCRLKAISVDGKSKSFSSHADGYGRGEGCGFVIAKRLSDALRDGDNIIAVVEGTEVMHDGKSNGLLAPNGLAQEKLIRSALTKAGVAPSDIDYVEAHASATPLGDPIEIDSLNNVYSKDRKETLLVGSVKSNIGHLEACAGIAGLIKLILSINNEMIPPSINCSELNPEVSWNSIPLKIVTDPTPWKRRENPRIAALSSLGLGGTIAHVIVKEPPVKSMASEDLISNNILTLSARSEAALTEMLKKYHSYILSTSEALANICYTSNISRSHMPVRAAFTCGSKEELQKKLQALIDKDNKLPTLNIQNQSIVFLFTGQGSQYPSMGKDLYLRFPVFKEAIDICDKLFIEHIDKSIVDLLYSDNSNQETLDRTIYTQPVIFSVEYALFKLWESFGIKPSYVIGHSIGSYCAACIAGVISLEDAVMLVASRGKIVQSLPDIGMMGTLMTNEENVISLIRDSGFSDVSIAAVNNQEIVTISGIKESVEKILAKAKENKIFVERLAISHAFHSPLIKPALQEFKQVLSKITFSRPKIPLISDLTGKKAEPSEIMSPEYWLNHITNPVRFYDAIKTIEKEGPQIFVEIGAKAILSGFTQESIDKKDILCLPSLRDSKPPWEQMSSSIILLYKFGINLNWDAIWGYKKLKRSILPNYPFQKKKFWFKQSESRDTNLLLQNNQYYHTQNSQNNQMKVNFNERGMEAQSMDSKLLENELKTLINEISGLEIAEIASDTDLFTYGFDSLMLVQLRNRIEKKYKVNVTLNKFMTDLRSVKIIADYLNEKMPKSVQHTVSDISTQKPLLSNNNLSTIIPSDKYLANSAQPQLDGSLQGIFNQQLLVMQMQLDTLSKFTGGTPSNGPYPESRYQQVPYETSKQAETNAKNESTEPASFTLRAMKFDDDPFTYDQKIFVSDLVKRYNSRTQKSKEFAQKNRAFLSDWISSLNFRMSFKDLIYPIQSSHSNGSRIWDVDGNEYIDMAIGYGVNYFGNRPQFIIDAVEAQLKEGWELGPQTDLAGEVSSLICELTGVERVAFSNTGSEAVMTAIRIARTVTQRRKVVIFKGAFHGNSDIVLGVTIGGKTIPSSPGIMQGVVEDLIVLEYGVPETLSKIREIGNDLAAVLVEPVQSRNPELQPKEFLHNLRALTEEMGTALIFDEIINGFRICQGGAQAHFGVRADIVTYGKIIGGGFPIGVIAGNAKYLDAVDGGWWQYGDDSFPDKEVTSFAGTFCKHPISMAACRAVLLRIKEEGQALQNRVNSLTANTVNILNNYFEENDVPLRIKYFASQFRFDGYGGLDLRKLPIEIELFFYLLINRGIYVWEKRICYFSAAHTNEDAEKFIQAIKDSVVELRAGGFEFSSKKKTPESQLIIKKFGANYFSMSSFQKGQFILDKMAKNSLAYHISGAMLVNGPLDVKKVNSVLEQLAKRHQMLRAGFEIIEGKQAQKIHDNVSLEAIYKKGSEAELDKYIKAFIAPFDLSQPPLVRVLVVEINPEKFLFAVDFHHIISDGITMGIFVQEFIRLYEGKPVFPVEKSYTDYVQLEENYFLNEEFNSHKQFWKEKLSGEIPELSLPADFKRPDKLTFNGQRICFSISKEKTEQLKSLGKSSGTSLFMIMFSLFDVLLQRLSGCEDIIIGIPMSVRLEPGYENCFGLLTNSIPFRTKPKSRKSYNELLNEIKAETLNTFAYGNYPFNNLVEDLKLKRIPGRNPLFDVMFSFENANDQVLKIKDLTFTNHEFELQYVTFDINFESMEKEGRIDIYFNYNSNLFKKETIEKWIEYFQKIVDTVICDKTIQLADIELKDQYKSSPKIPYDLVELKSIEDTLLKFPGILEASVISETSNNGTVKLIAFYTTDSSFEHDLKGLKSFVTERFKASVTPSMYIKVDEIPKLHDGSIDREELLKKSNKLINLPKLNLKN
ncbi:MAG: aminotransferase class III-fold pyridoxal phosphate-dependent enzyme [Bacillota bacterium]|nr:aminotransferase class III-fold pyridoxal phosphate-dependent enzyme [Bacillota bacterium]